MARNPFKRKIIGCRNDLIRNLKDFFKSPDCYLPARSGCIVPERTNDLFPLWQQIYAESFLFQWILNNDSDTPDEETASILPFGQNTPALSELLQQPGAVVVFPTCSIADAHQWRLYLFEKPAGQKWNDHKHFLTGSECIDPRLSVFLINELFEPVSTLIDGKSWQLAYYLAQRILERRKNQGIQKIQKTLAFDYLITGAVREGRVESVQIGNKTELLKKNKRRFMLPDGCRGLDELAELPDNRCHYVKDVDQAWKLISKTGVTQNDVELPDSISHLNILVGESCFPVLSVLFLINPEKIVLWCSSKTREKAELIRDTLDKIPEISASVELRTMDSHDLQQSYQDFREAIDLQENHNSSCISMTGGNRLMGIAAQLVAMEFNIQLVYRDFNAQPDTLTVIQFGANNNYESNDITINRCPVKDLICWDTLYNKEPSFNSSEDLLKQFYRAKAENPMR